MIIDLIVVLKKRKDPDPKAIISVPDPDSRIRQAQNVTGSFGSRSGTLVQSGHIENYVSDIRHPTFCMLI
jgi:hypothetical protein